MARKDNFAGVQDVEFVVQGKEGRNRGAGVEVGGDDFVVVAVDGEDGFKDHIEFPEADAELGVALGPDLRGLVVRDS